MSGLAQASCQLTRVRNANSRSAKGWPRNRTKYSYDANGNAITRQGSTINWSSFNYPDSISAGSGSTAETVTLSYGPDRRRWQQVYTGNGTTETTSYVGRDLEVVTWPGQTEYRHYIYAGNEPIGVSTRSATSGNWVDFLLFDQQGSVTAMTYGGPTTYLNESFTPFGNRRNPSTWSGPPSNSDLITASQTTREAYTFQTQLGLWMGMNHMNGRVQDAVTGRMLSGDPFTPDLTNAQSYNRYSYVSNNPLTNTDPNGFGYYAICFTPAPPPDDGSPPGDINVTSTPLPTCTFVNIPVPDVTGGGSGGGGGGSNSKPQGDQDKQTPTVCTGVGRGLSGNTSLVGRQGGIPGQTVQPNTAAVIPQQFGVPGGAALAPYAPNINGTIGQAPFSAVTDVIGGKSPIPGVPVRTALQQLFPGQLILEIPGASDQGANAPVTITVPPGVGCPTGTSPAPAAGGP